MTDPVNLPLPRNVPLAWLATVLSVDSTTGVCSIDIGDGAALTEIIYLGPAPVVGRQVIMLMFRSTSVVLGGG